MDYNSCCHGFSIDKDCSLNQTVSSYDLVTLRRTGTRSRKRERAWHNRKQMSVGPRPCLRQCEHFHMVLHISFGPFTSASAVSVQRGYAIKGLFTLDEHESKSEKDQRRISTIDQRKDFKYQRKCSLLHSLLLGVNGF